MNATFEKRLLRKSAKSRLGKISAGKFKSTADLRQKLSRKRLLDARSVLRNRRRTKTLVTNRKTGTLLRKISRNGALRGVRKVSKRPVKRLLSNASQRPFRPRVSRNQRRPIRRYPVSAIPDLLSLPVVPPIFQPLFGSSTRLVPSAISAETSMSTPSTSSKLSPIQGFRLSVKNLLPSVTLDDIYELFSNVGSLRLCNLVRPGHAEVVYNELADAKEAINRYHNRELDGRPMSIALITQVTGESGGSNRMASRLGPKIDRSWGAAQSASRPLTTKSFSGNTRNSSEVDVDVIRKALFNVSSGPASSRRPVDFNVSLR